MHGNIAIALLAATVMLVACGGAKDQTAAKPDSVPAPVAAATPAAAPGADAYQVCATCHQATGEGLPPAFPPLVGSDFVNGPGEPHIAIVLKGLTGPVVVKGQTFNGVMAAWESLPDDQIAAAINYERASWGNTGTPVTVQDVAAVRAAVKSRTTAWTADDLKKATLR
jgi:mono/diheme cytochrome c family protein